MSESLRQNGVVTSLAFPDYQNAPAQSLEGLFCLAVPSHISAKLGVPECQVGFRTVCEVATRMPVPKATMNQEHCSVLWKDNIGLAGQILTVQSEAISKPVKERSHYSLGDSVSALDARHIPTTTFFRDSVSHD
jgi:hypothetical protein